MIFDDHPGSYEIGNLASTYGVPKTTGPGREFPFVTDKSGVWIRCAGLRRGIPGSWRLGRIRQQHPPPGRQREPGVAIMPRPLVSTSGISITSANLSMM